MDIAVELKPLAATLFNLKIGQYLSSDSFDNLMLEHDFDEMWNAAIDEANDHKDFIKTTHYHLFEEAYFKIIMFFCKKRNWDKFFEFIKISIIGLIEFKKEIQNPEKLLLQLELLEMLEEDLKDIRIAIDKKTTSKKGTAPQIQKNNSVFIGHGRSVIWREVESFLKKEGLVCEAFETDSRAGSHIIDILKEMLDKATFAVIVVTAEDLTENGTVRARQNVIHEIGLFQGRLGFEKVVILKQREAEHFSNNAGLQHIEFTGINIKHTFYELREALMKAGLIAK